ncbi:MAG: sodium:proton antiporter [Bacteroidota bacterium]|nr:sodium:proton antiporter [Bacteroidota bacterium]MXW14105.1 citrate transporter [Rhodothermaceae bacterium]MDE2645913.1 sodium:proton antiporter [Bacteroidota bacterium]MXW33734.1 citrate transporter [Rhodothermaceae bacterium]MXZ18728.1 citrate transporter [Rhodothermaceae bacterium]
MTIPRVLYLWFVLFLVTSTAFAQVDGATADTVHEVDGSAEEVMESTEDADHAVQDATAEEGDHEEGYGGGHAKVLPPLWLVAPFVILLLMIATGPLFYGHHWHHHYPKYAVGLGLFVTVYYLFVLHDGISMLHALQEYLSFIALVASLFIAASGIFLKVNARGTPLANISLLSVGAVIANLIATTGAAMLFIRPYMRLNRGRLKAYHIVFFIFIVANVGGAMTPIGDPPLFLGFLRGVPFFWTAANLWYIWAPTIVVLLAIFYVIDSSNKAESTTDISSGKTIELQGNRSFIFVVIIVISVFIDPNVITQLKGTSFDLVGTYHLPFGIREIIMFSMCVLAFKFCDQDALKKNEFTFEPIREVGWLFLGIFACMVPALALISNYASENADGLNATTFYWGTGILSGVLDNAPTYLNFLAAAMGKFGLDVNVAMDVKEFASVDALYLSAISIAAVFFGAMTYIGNAPNFMVKAIAESNGVDVPSFVGYLVKYGLTILLPVYAVVWLIFYSGWIL